jgi:hypothetical protein
MGPVICCAPRSRGVASDMSSCAYIGEAGTTITSHGGRRQELACQRSERRTTMHNREHARMGAGAVTKAAGITQNHRVVPPRPAAIEVRLLELVGLAIQEASMRRIASIIAGSIATVTALAGCPSREVSKVDISQAKRDKKNIPVVAERDIDILFVIDDSESMEDEQNSLAANFPLFIDKLENIQGGLPNVHIGVISTNVGAHPDIDKCAPEDSKNGVLQSAFTTNPAFPQCADGGGLSLDGTFIRDVLNEDTKERERNYTGDLAGVFSCMAVLGIEGCGFEMQLEAMYKALSPDANAGFLREDAFLAIIFITDEDDCSAPDARMFDPTVTSKESALGPIDSFRCFEFGVQCNPDNPRILGDKVDCAPREDSPYMYSVQRYVDFVKSLKPNDPTKVIVAGIIGYDEENPDEPLEVITEIKQVGEVFSLVPACQIMGTDPEGNPIVTSKATPGVRLRAFLEQFPERNTITTICNDDLSGALDIISEELRALLDNPNCLTSDVFIREETADVRPYDCQVSEVLFGEETALPHCDSPDESATNKPCWHIRVNMDGCAAAGAPFQEVVVEREMDQQPNSATDIVVQCAVK